ncbi:MAG: carboxypeptidase regulatory-like domain-containing protein [Actinophytocola sp.]|uniref:carboxypeptidase regulatory-like domain-containing protein n=1 Tax=Actinophytocola sp. TaxID=1872138 RepID=UPI003C71A76B
MTRFYRIERSVLYSPAWFVPFDEFTGRQRTAGVTVALDRFDTGENTWLPQDTQAVRTPSAAITFPGLGRRGGPGPGRFRARFGAAGYAPLYPADDEPFVADALGVEFLTYPYDDTQPPAVPAEPRLVRLLPGAAFPYGPGVRTVYGVVVDAAARTPVANALVVADGTTGVDGVPWRERTLTDALGVFRLALRWEGEPADPPDDTETFRLLATERPGRTGSLAIRLPGDRDRGHVIEIVSE